MKAASIVVVLLENCSSMAWPAVNGLKLAVNVPYRLIVRFPEELEFRGIVEFWFRFSNCCTSRHG